MLQTACFMLFNKIPAKLKSFENIFTYFDVWHEQKITNFLIFSYRYLYHI